MQPATTYPGPLDGGSAALSSTSSSAQAGRLDWLGRVLLAIVLVEIPLQLDTFVNHSLDDAEFGAISGFNVSLSTVCLVLLYLIWLPQWTVSSTKLRTNIGLALYLVFAVFSVMWAGDKSRSLFEIWLLVQSFLLFTFVINTIRSEADVLFVMTFLVLGLVVQGLFMVGTRLIDDDLRFGPIEFQIYSGSQRVSGSLGSPNVASSYVALLIAPCLSLLLTPVSKWLKILAVSAVLLGGIGLVLTMSRGGWMAAGLSLAILVAVAVKKRWLSVWFLLALVTGMIVFAIAFQQPLAARLLGDDGGSAAARWPLANIAVQMVADQPLGVGVNNWELAARPYAEAAGFAGQWFFTVHNKYLLLLSEIGLFGLLAYIVFLVSTIACGRAAWKRGHPVLSPLALGLTAAVIAQSVHMFADIFNSRQQVMMLWLVAAIIMVIERVTRENG